MNSHIHIEERQIVVISLVAALGRTQHHQHCPAFHAGALLNDRNIFQVFGNRVQQLLRNLRVVNLPTTKADANPHLHAITDPLACGLNFEHPMVIGCLRAQANLFDLNLLLCLASFTLFLGLFVLELAKIHNLADRWFGVGGNLHQIQICLIREFHCFTRRDNTNILPFCVNQANFTITDLFVYAVR
jgi:hypothetical protein